MFNVHYTISIIGSLRTRPFTSYSARIFSPDLVNVNIVKNLGLVKILVPPILLLLWSKITVDLVKKLDLVKVLVPPKNFTKSGLYCIRFSLVFLMLLPCLLLHPD